MPRRPFDHARDDATITTMPGVTVAVSARKFAVPFECPCCGATPDADLAIPYTSAKATPAASDTAKWLEFPYCRRCVTHAAHWESADRTSGRVLGVGVLAAIAVGIAVSWLAGSLVFLGAITLALFLVLAGRGRARAGCGPACAFPGKAVAYYGWSGNASTFAFESPTYAARFAEQNTGKLVDVTPQLRALLEGYKVARLAVPTPAAPSLVVPPPLELRDWIARIESEGSGSGRRNMLKRALDTIHDPADRKRLVEIASAIEVAVIMEPIERLPSPAAKRRKLQDAIEHVRGDNLPEELQEAALRQLEAKSR